MGTTIKVVASVVGVLFAALAYTVAFSLITLRIHNAQALGWPSLQSDPLFWFLGMLVVSVVVWRCWRWISRYRYNREWIKKHPYQLVSRCFAKLTRPHCRLPVV